MGKQSYYDQKKKSMMDIWYNVEYKSRKEKMRKRKMFFLMNVGLVGVGEGSRGK